MSDEYNFAIVGGALLTPPDETSPLGSHPADGKAPAPAESDPLQAGANAEVPAPTVVSEKLKKLSKKRFEKELDAFRETWQSFEKAVVASGTKLVILVEGRDAGRERGIVSRIVEFANPRVCRVARVDAPGARERSQWFLQPYVAHLPAAGEIALFDGGWYSRATLDRATGTFSQDEYAAVLKACADFERVLVRSGVVIQKYWLSVEGGREELIEQLTNLGRRWNVSTKALVDLDYAALREEIFSATDIEEAPWILVSDPDRREARLRLIRNIAGSIVGAAGADPDCAAEPAGERPLVEEPDSQEP